jgi:small multidrug resistance pump
MNFPIIAYGYLLAAIIAEVLGSTMLAKSEQFTKLVPTIAMVACFGFAFFCLSLVLKHMPLGFAYAIWAGLGIVLTAIVSAVLFKQSIDLAGIIGIGMIVVGVVVINLLSKSSGH